MRNKTVEEKLEMWKKRDSVGDYFFKSTALTNVQYYFIWVLNPNFLQLQGRNRFRG